MPPARIRASGPGGEPDATPSPTPSSAAPSPTPSPAEAADGPINPVPAGYTGRFRIAAMVLENAGHGPQVCIGPIATVATIATSDPPLCGGPDVVGWSWDAVPHESRSGTTWGGYVLVGTFDGARFTLTEPARPASSADYPKRPPWPDYTSPCPEPPGGWRPVDPKKTTLDTLDRVFGVARALPDYAGLWINQLPPSGEGGRWIAELTVVNVRFTRDLSRHEAELRKVWGGPLCVTSARYTEARLWAIVRELDAPRRFHYAASDVVRNRIDLGVWVADLAWQEELDARYGTGAVRLVGDLQPLD